MTIALQAGSFFGDTASVRIGGAVLSEVRHETGRAVPPHTHEYAYFCLLIEGAYRETSAGTTIEYDPFTVVFHAPRKEHTDTIGPAGGRFFMIELLPAWVEAMSAQGALPEHFTELRGGECAWLMSRLYQEFLMRGATTEFAVESLLYQLCATAADTAALPIEEPAWMSDVDRRIQATFGEKTLVRDLASEVPRSRLAPLSRIPPISRPHDWRLRRRPTHATGVPGGSSRPNAAWATSPPRPASRHKAI